MYKKIIYVLISVLFFFVTFAWATQREGESLAKQLQLIPGTKASIQWKRIFRSEQKRKRYGLDKLSQEQLLALQRYLLEHAADSPKPIVPGL